jgi:ABC-type branched-subunit amino acid transport system substrate-binding protein
MAAFTATSCGGSDSSSSQGAASGDIKCNKDQETAGVSDDAIKIGNTVPYSGPASVVGKAVVEGNKLAVKRANADGGVQGHQIDFKYYDDGFEPDRAVTNVRRLIDRDQVFLISGGSGTTTHLAAAPIIDQEGIPAIGPYAPATTIGTMDNPHIWSIWTNYDAELEVVGGYAIDHGSEKFGILRLTGDVGDSAKRGLEEAIKAKGKGEIVGDVESSATATDFSGIAQQLKKSGADTVVLAHIPSLAGDALAAMHRIGYQPKLVADSDMTDEEWISSYSKDNNGAIVASKLAPLDDPDPMVREFVDAFKSEYGKDPSTWNAVGYVQMEVALEAMRKAPELTRSCVEFALSRMEGYKTGILPPITFGPRERQGVLGTGINRIEDGKLVTIERFRTVD